MYTGKQIVLVVVTTLLGGVELAGSDPGLGQVWGEEADGE
jgi:hypothetical protein